MLPLTMTNCINFGTAVYDGERYACASLPRAQASVRASFCARQLWRRVHPRLCTAAEYACPLTRPRSAHSYLVSGAGDSQRTPCAAIARYDTAAPLGAYGSWKIFDGSAQVRGQGLY